MTIPVIDVENTSARLKSIREQRGIKISELQNLFNMTNPQSIYNWENSAMKTLPRIDNLVILARLYNVTLDDLIVIREEKTDCLEFSEPVVSFMIESEVMEFIRNNSSRKIRIALSSFFNVEFSLSY